MSADNLVIVESPAKAKTINKYLGPDFEVIASYGHIRDLVNKDGSVLPDEDFAMRWQAGERAGKNINDIKRAAKKVGHIWLATDPDREGEAISWHVQEMLAENGLTKGKTVRRVAFNEITKTAIQEAFKNARALDQPLIDAYLARRALDYLVGFNISPVLWRKLPGSKSAGRVQSVALRLICEREYEIEIFKAQEYWSIETRLHTADGAPFTARLTHLAGNKLDKLDIHNEHDAMQAVARIKNKALSVQKIDKKQVRRAPAPPFITSSLQMEAARKLGFSAANTMRVAQGLYEAGHITYMRTDGTTLSVEAVQQCRAMIKKEYGEKYVPDAPRLYKSKAKNAQEAHEAIRPTDLSKLPAKVGASMDETQRKLYDLIWKRTVASQMENAVMDQMSVDISDGTDDVVLRANGSVVLFDGFLTLYQENDTDDDDSKSPDSKDRRLPPMSEGEKTKLVDVTPSQHFTQAPPRYSEASLVKRMEELGIGRPSTYASTLQVLRDRNYVTMDQKRFVPEDRGRVVTSFLGKFFSKYVDYDFTANLEEELDAIAGGHLAWKEALRLFWTDFKAAIDGTKNLTITDVINYLDDELAPHFFQSSPENPEPRKCKSCENGRLGLKLGKFGAFIGCSHYPECRFTRPLELASTDGEGGENATLGGEPKILGTEPGTGRTVSLRKGPYGPYVQIDAPPESAAQTAALESAYRDALTQWEAAKKQAKKDKEKAPPKPKKPAKPGPKRQGLPRGAKPEDVTLADALSLLALPRLVGTHPETGKTIEAGLGRFGPFVKHDGMFVSLGKDDDVMSVGMNRAVDLIAQKVAKLASGEAPKRGFARKAPAKTAPEKKAVTKKAAPKKKTVKKS